MAMYQVPTNGRPKNEISYDEFPVDTKTCAKCRQVLHISNYLIVIRKDTACIYSYCNECKKMSQRVNRKTAHYNITLITPDTCNCGLPAKPIRHWNEWVEMECSFGHLWFAPRKIDKRSLEWKPDRAMVRS